MSTIYPLAQSLFVNKQSQPAIHQQSQNSASNTTNKGDEVAAIEGDYIKIGDSTSFFEAQNMFERANQYKKMSNTAHYGLQAYTSIDAESQRDALRKLMGVDLYA